MQTIMRCKDGKEICTTINALVDSVRKRALIKHYPIDKCNDSWTYGNFVGFPTTSCGSNSTCCSSGSSSPLVASSLGPSSTTSNITTLTASPSTTTLELSTLILDDC